MHADAHTTRARPVATILLLATALASGCAVQSVEQPFQFDLGTTEGALWVRGTNDAGETCVVAGEGDHVVVRGTVRIRSASLGTARAAARAFSAKPSFRFADGVLELTSPDLARTCGADCRGAGQLPVDGTVDWEVEVPASASATLASTSGRVCASGLEGAVSLRSESGDVAATGLRGSLTVVTSSGNAFVHDVAELELHTVSGAVSASGLSSSAGISTTSGDVRIDGATADLAIESTSGDLTVASALGRDATWSLVTGSGEIEGKLPESQGFRVEFHSLSGRLLSEFPVQPNQGLVSGHVGDPAGLIHARTVSGDLRLSRSTSR